ncbi:MAG: divergent polysaccharide deacetylase family protein, partial [Rhodospirillales bacterium]|nr:divergent polysaccharide deacetylase family protein [Rhodospirillales bacterium]
AAPAAALSAGMAGLRPGRAPAANPNAANPNAAVPGAANPGATNPAASAPVAAPDPALAEARDPADPAALPRIGPDGQAAMAVYAAPFAAPATTPRIALVLGGIGMDAEASQAAIRVLPGAVTLAVSPYAPDPAPLLAQARAAGHEYLVELPLEPARYPLNDPGPQTLLTGAPAGQNKMRLDWALTRFAGYVGAIGALAGMQGERFAHDPVLMHRLARRLAGRGLLYVDPRPGAAALPDLWQRDVDVVIDTPPDRAAIAAALGRLAALARRNGSALGYAASPATTTLAAIAAWAGTLAGQRLVLAPASAIMHPPPAAGPDAKSPETPQ